MAAFVPARPLGTAAPAPFSCPCGVSARIQLRRLLSSEGGFAAVKPLRLRVVSCSKAGSGSFGPHWESGTVGVVGIGSRKDAVVDFCLDAPLASSSRLRFWTIQALDSPKMQLLQRASGKDMELKNVEFPLSPHSCPSAVILVASAGHGSDDISALQFLNAAKSAGGLAVAILLKPFSFEGQRRQQEVDDLIGKLQKCSQFHIVVETDALLKTEEETLAEAIRTVNNAVLLAINMVSVLITDTHLKFIDTPDEQIKELSISEILKLLEGYGEAKVGYGAGYNIKSSIMQAAFNCPFLTSGLKGINGMVMLTISSAIMMSTSELCAVVHTFRQVTGCNKQIIFCGVHETDLEQNQVITTLLVPSCTEQKVIVKQGFLSGLLRHFPFLSSLLGDHSELSDSESNNYDNHQVDDAIILSDDGCSSNLNVTDGTFESFSSCPEELGTESSNKAVNLQAKNTISLLETSNDFILDDECQTNEEKNGFQEEQLDSGNFGPGFHIAQLWATERAALSGTTSKADKVDGFSLPIGTKFPGQCNYDQESSEPNNHKTWNGTREENLDGSSFPARDAVTGASLEAVMDVYNSALTLLRRREVSSRKPGLASVRAASMLEAERESEKRWSPIMEMDYRGGLYRGRCQGGLPEGKGRLTLTDGSFYDGMWRYGKRSGLGTFCYCNGDVFQGTWRDDVMHGKGWFYFHTGDRWFANFWKGKANGEGRFYSKSGSVFFGHFRNGWRHGESLYINGDGSRWAEVWEDGVLVNRTKLDSQRRE